MVRDYLVIFCHRFPYLLAAILTDVQNYGTLNVMNSADALLTVRQLQELLQVDRITIYRMLNDGRLQGFKVGGQWRFSREAIESWLQEQRGCGREELPSETEAQLSPTLEPLPLPCVRAIQDILAQALSVGVVTTEVGGLPLTPIANCSDFCDLVLSSEVGRQRCIASWQASVAAPGKATHPFICHAGLRYISCRIEAQGRFVGAVHAGQYLDEPPGEEFHSVRIPELATACGLGVPDLLHALNRIPVLDENRQQQLVVLLNKTAEVFSEIGEERLALLNRLQRIAEITQL